MTGRRARSVAIIGGGPAGAQCARTLCEHGVAVTLFEPRSAYEKACGGGIPARSLGRFPCLADSRLQAKVIRSCAVIAPSGRESEFPLADPIHVFRRADLHAFLLGRAIAAGARLERRRVLSFDREAGPRAAGGGGPFDGPGAGRWIVRAAPAGAEEAVTGAAGPAPRSPGSLPGAARLTSHGPYDFLVAADGAAGPARARLVPRPPARDLTQGIGYYAPDLVEDRITLKFFERLNGYLWVFPRLDHASAGICARLGERPAAALRSFLDRFLEERYGPGIPGRSGHYAALIPVAAGGGAAAPMQGDGWALIGDAAHLVDPLTREGIHYALLSGETLALALAEGRPERYAIEWSRRHADEFAWAAGHVRGFFDARFIERLVASCALSPRVTRILSDLIAGRQPYRRLKARLVLNAPLIALQAVMRLRRARGRRSTGRSGDGSGRADACRPGRGTRGSAPRPGCEDDRRRRGSAAGGG